jgi:ATPase subunit of ABC transporter with duplicated ATPase domains
VCTHIADIDFGKISFYGGNYSFWYESSQLALRQRSDQNRKVEDKRKELEDFVRRFSANASKSKQATSRKKMLEKLTIDEIKPSSRRYPHINFKPEREMGDQLLEVENLSYQLEDGTVLFSNVTFKLDPNDKVAIIAKDPLAITTLFQILAGEKEPTTGSFKWGVTTTQAYLPNDNHSYFNNAELNLVDWLRQYSKEKDESFIRGFLGRMLFSGEEALKKSNVLSGGEKVRCMLSRMMLQGANVLLMDEPTNHLDLEAITALDAGMKEFKGSILFASHDIQIVNTVANRIVEISPKGCVDKVMTYEEYLDNDKVKEQVAAIY